MSSFMTQFDEAEYTPTVHLVTVYSRCSVLTNFWLLVSAVPMSVVVVGGRGNLAGVLPRALLLFPSPSPVATAKFSHTTTSCFPPHNLHAF